MNNKCFLHILNTSMSLQCAMTNKNSNKEANRCSHITDIVEMLILV